MRYFAGDGEAVVRCEVTLPDGLQLADGTARGGRAMVEGNKVIVDYGASPRAGESVDTLEVMVVARVDEADVHLEGSIYSSLDAAGGPAHSVQIPVSVRPPVTLKVEWGPMSAFPGQSVDLALAIRNLDERGRSIERIDWDWPEGVEPLGEADTAWDPPLEAGEEVTSVLRLKIEPGKTDRLTLSGRAESEEVVGSPLPLVSVELAPAPIPMIEPEGQTLVVGESTELTFIWVNPGTEGMEVDGFELIAPIALGATAAANQSDVAVEEDREGQSARFRVKTEDVAPGASVRLALVVAPSRPGPFSLIGSFRPRGQTEFVPMATEMWVAVVAREEEERSGGAAAAAELTDLESVSLAFRDELSRQLESLPLNVGARVYLKATGDQKSWIVDDILSRGPAEGRLQSRPGGARGRDKGQHTSLPTRRCAGGIQLRRRVVESFLGYSEARGLWRPVPQSGGRGAAT